ncbi:hypothetical protein PCANC_04827 [Puccinia coronata f. sp. avenae]|uniref:Uncharacterized protein n=1 Tax=Puccinia coronata f. sp. avenae TaxID=200324 RepID=A0A2N5T2G3_9BASI|nr:hypothetical protein PCASD_16862 [Puccinia coronata f. sp. avenae]PLW19683.1 hypothetical protein PCANC_08922 [Puccinia coronata f. sp. avenae]PLW47689.1 hypothetical protein PCASD_04094 [Puccinia coronata f. sp. avenae]PLW56481.1 hypothetical protein PCANC_04827 [Puccinia coronata f. sp. avenae]
MSLSSSPVSSLGFNLISWSSDSCDSIDLVQRLRGVQQLDDPTMVAGLIPMYQYPPSAFGVTTSNKVNNSVCTSY